MVADTKLKVAQKAKDDAKAKQDLAASAKSHAEVWNLFYHAVNLEFGGRRLYNIMCEYPFFPGRKEGAEQTPGCREGPYCEDLWQRLFLVMLTPVN